MAKRKLLTIDDLVRFCQDQKVVRFSSKQSGYPLAVQVPTTFEIDDDDNDSHRGMVRLKFRIFHTGLNRNRTFVSEDAANDAAPTIADRPILAAIHQLDDGSWDFEGHEMEKIENEDGEEEINYIEKQVGSFSSESPFWEHDDELNKDYLCAYGYIAEEYTKAADILRQKDGGSKNSCELVIENMAFNAKDKYLDLKKFYLSASTLLGSKDDGTPIGEGMLGSRADMVEFSREKNSIQFETNEDLKKFIQDSIKEAFDNINSIGKEENQMDFEENSKVTSEDEGAVNETATDEGVSGEKSTEETEVTVVQSKETNDGAPSEEKKFTKTFEISHEDIRVALYNLLTPYEEQDNDWYGITAVYDDHFIYEGWFNESNKYSQNYKKDGDDITLNGERVHVNVEYLTDSELDSLNEMRSNYSSISEELGKFKAEPEKMEILNSEVYSSIADSEEFVEFKKQDSHFNFSVDEVRAKADEILLNAAKSGSVKFAQTTESKPTVTMKPILFNQPSKRGRYGGLGKKKED